MAKFLVVKKLKALYPIDDVGEAAMRNLAQGEIISVEVKRPRNVQFHRKFFAMLSIILENQDYYKSIDDLLCVCKIRVGHCHAIETKLGQVLIPDSISFASMDDVAFAAFYERACAWVATEVVPGLKRADLDQEVEAQLLEFGA